MGLFSLSTNGTLSSVTNGTLSSIYKRDFFLYLSEMGHSIQLANQYRSYHSIAEKFQNIFSPTGLFKGLANSTKIIYEFWI
jgi:hypothetical protein